MVLTVHAAEPGELGRGSDAGASMADQTPAGP
jgi:hypothetical protein